LSNQNEVHKAIQRALKDNPKLYKATAEEVSYQLVLEEYLKEEPPVSLVADGLGIMRAEQQAFAPGIRPKDV
jgi:uncharacterized protein YneF (UPF0154 family)